MATRIQSHQLSGGLYVSGRPKQPKDRQPTMGSRAIPYTGGDVKKSGELGKMFDIPGLDPRSTSGTGPPNLKPTRIPSSSQQTSGPVRSRPNSGPILQPTGLITSGPLRSGQPDPPLRSGKAAYGSAVTSLSEDNRSRIPGYLRRYSDAELRGAIDGQFVKVTGVVTCGSIPLESSFQRVPRCVYASTELFEYRGLGGKSVNPKHRFFSWGCSYSERYVADFYISDFQTGLRALVKAGYGAKVVPFVKPTTVVDIKKSNKDLSPTFLRWLADRKISSDDCVMRLKESYIKEGSTISVMGIVRRHHNVLMIVPPSEPASIGCQLTSCLLPTYVEGLVLACDESQNADVIPA